MSLRSLDMGQARGLESNLTGACLLTIKAPDDRPTLRGMTLRRRAERHMERVAML